MSILNPNKNIRFYIDGNKIIKEHTTRSVCLDADFQQVLFDSHDSGWAVQTGSKPIQALENINDDIVFFDTTENSLIKAIRINNSIQFSSDAHICDGKWKPNFYSSDQKAFRWFLKPSMNASFVIIERYNVVEGASSEPFLSYATLVYAEKDSLDPNKIHTYAPPFPNVYENGQICLGNYDIKKHKFTLSESESFKLVSEILSGGWNQDLYRHYPLYGSPNESNDFVGKILPNLDKVSNHGFLRTTDSTQIKVVHHLANKTRLIK